MTGRGEVVRLRSRLEAAIRRAPPASADVELQSDFAKYLCVLASGFLENALVALVLDYAARRSAPDVAYFVERKLDFWTNANTEKIAKLLGDFKDEWQLEAELFLVDDRKAAVNSLIALRHKIAHGESVGTSLAQVKAYLVRVDEVVEFVALLCDK